MGCNCNKPTPPPAPVPNQSSGQTQTFELALSSGKTLSFGSKLEAEAENVRLGYTGRVRPSSS